MTEQEKENIRMRVAAQLDKQEKYCWSDLVLWAHGHIDVKTLFKRNSQECKEESTEIQCQRCYCGKFEGGKERHGVNPYSVNVEPLFI